jgi:hypothetical protein
MQKKYQISSTYLKSPKKEKEDKSIHSVYHMPTNSTIKNLALTT